MEDHKQFYIEIGRRIADARQAIGMSQEKAADAIHVTRVTWNHIEKGTQKLSLDRLMDIAKLLQVSPSKFVPGFLSDDPIDIATGKNFSSEEQNLVLEKLAKYKKDK